jgi:hypothetical protein
MIKKSIARILTSDSHACIKTLKTKSLSLGGTLGFLFASSILPVVFVTATLIDTSSGQTQRAVLNIQRVADMVPPPGYSRVKADTGTFAAWLRQLPLKHDTSRIHLYNGEIKHYQAANFRIVDLDIGSTDLQQCADAIIRLRAEYLFSVGRLRDIAFDFTSGDRARFDRWIDGWRPTIQRDRVSWQKRAGIDSSYHNLREYLNTVFNYAGSYSLERELKQVSNLGDIHPGDCIVEGDFPGHAIIVIDEAVNNTTGQMVVMLAQSYMPAQDIHILRNLNETTLGPWYLVGHGDTLDTPEWTFNWNALYRFPE